MSIAPNKALHNFMTQENQHVVAQNIISLPTDYAVHDKSEFFVLIAKSTDLMPVIYPDQLMLMRINSYANAGDIVMLNDDVTAPVVGFCQDAGFYDAVCVAAKPQVLELLPDGTVSQRA